MSNKTDAQWILNALDLAADTCQTIQENGGCDRCPLYTTCLDENNFLDVAYAFNVDHWRDFLGFADDINGYISNEDAEALYWDDRRKMEIEERMIDEEYGL